MTPSDPSELRRSHARRAYETGRLRAAAVEGLYVAPLSIASLVGCNGRAITVALTVALYALAVTLLWRGRAWGKAVGPGLVAGAAPLLLPMLLRAAGHGCTGGVCWLGCVTACVAGGLVAGALLGWRARAMGPARGLFLLAAASVAILTGSLGCVMVGVAGVIGMIASLLVAATPALLVPRRA